MKVNNDSYQDGVFIKKKFLFVFNPSQHPFHLVQPSPYPYIIAWVIFNMIIILLLKFDGITVPGNSMYCLFFLLMYYLGRWWITFATIRWFWSVVLESTYEGRHTYAVQKNIRFGFILFIVSEVMFFASFFFSYFYLAVWPSSEIGYMWPPVGLQTINPWSLPLVNTFILLSSGVTVTWAHKILTQQYTGQSDREKLIYKIISSNLKYEDSFESELWTACYRHTNEDAWEYWEEYIEEERPWIYNPRESITVALVLTIGLGILFTYVQLYEYKHAQFSIWTSVYGSLFYIITGFHGLHVIVGTVFLAVCLLRHLFYHFTRDHHLGLELAIWYWHFVDVVWIFLFLCLYWWGA